MVIPVLVKQYIHIEMAARIILIQSKAATVTELMAVSRIYQ